MKGKNWRLNPSIFNSRWYPLSLTRKNLTYIISKYISKNNNLVLADYGCGGMPYKPLFAEYVKQYIGFDLKENEKADINFSPKGEINLKNDSVELVLSTQVLEHVEDPTFYLQECFRILKNNGLLIISTHGYWIYHPTPFDYWRWTSSGLKKILNDAGFEIEYFKGIISRPATGILLLQDGIIYKMPKFLRPIIAFPFQILMFFIDKILATQKSRDKDAAVYIVVCKASKIKT